MSTPLNVDDQHRLVEAILRIEGMRVRRGREVLLAALERDLGHRLPFEHHDQDRLDVWALVDVLLNYPGAAHALVRNLERFYKGSLSVAALRDLVRELIPEPWLAQDARRELHQLITSLEQFDPGLTHLSRFPMLYRRAVGPAWPLLDREMRSLHDVVALLEEIPAGRDGVPPLLIFADDLARYAAQPTAPAIRDWVRRQAVFQGVDDALFQRQNAEVEARARPEPSETYLIIACTPDALEPDRYLVTAWLQVDREPGSTLQCSDEALPLSRIPELLERLLTAESSVVGRPTPDLTVEFVLPRPLLGHPVEDSKIKIAGFEHRIGIKYPVVVRSLDRMRLAAVHHDWRRKWTVLRGNAVDAPVCLVTRRGEYDQEELFSKLSESPAVLALAFPPWAASDEPDEHWVGLLSGTPVIAWCRDGRDPARFAREVKDLLAADLMKLPRRAMELRRQALSAGAEEAGTGHLGLHLTLVFDDADRIPEPYVRLRPPA
ncbi:effector-associated domain 2-containing protein [Actinomadura nitritigenes]|uniref:VMAP-C domain-containing protein n=1 Tax=Actinomadura nitritigenes TaxID=134602 RepID=UPI003D8C2522